MGNTPLLTQVVVGAQRSYVHRFAFFGVFLLVFFVTFSLLLALDLVPNAVSLSPDARANKEPMTKDVGFVGASPLVENASIRPLLSADVSDAGILARLKGEYPELIEIPAIRLKAQVDNPNSTDVEVLDEALLSGAVRYPTSAKLGVSGNVVLFGHSSYLPIVQNQAFKAFNGIQNLKVGDEIIVYSDTKAYVYAVEEVGEADAEADAIPLSVAGQKLTLSTCDSFGAKTDRFIVIADLVETRPI